MPDNSFTIGAAVNVQQLANGMNQGVQITREALDKMLVDFSNASSASSRAVAKISDDTRAAATSVDASWKRVTEASLSYTAALKEVSGATYLARVAGEGDAASTSLLAAAKQKAAAAAMELAEAEDAAGIATKGASEANIEARLTTDVLTGNVARADQALIRFASHSELIGPIISAAFVPFAIATFAEILFRAGEKAYELFQNIVLLRGAIEALEKVEASSGEKAASLNYEYEESVARRLKAQGKLNEATAEFAKAASDKPLELIKVTDKDALKQFSADFISFLSAVHTTSQAPSVIARIGAEAASTAKQLEEAKRIRDEIAATPPTPTTGDPTVDTATSGTGGNELALKRQDKLITDLTAKASILHNAMSQVQSETGIASENALTQQAEDEKKKPKKDTRMEEWRAELQAKKDAEDGFHELSRSEEAKFWESKLAVAKGSGKLYAEVYHQMRDDERAAQKDSLKDETTAVQERIAGTKQGSVERVAILQEEVAHLKSIGADETEEYKRGQIELTEAVRALAEEQGKVAIEAERRKVDATRKGSEERVAAERAVLAVLRSLGLQETSIYTEQLNRITEAVRAAAAERVQLQELDVEQARIVGQSKLQIERQNVQAQFDLHRINAQQRISQFKQIEDGEYEIAKQAMEKKLALERGKGSDSSLVEQQKIQNQIENLTREHNNRIAQLNTESLKESQRQFDQFFAHLNPAFQSSINGWLQGTQTFARSMQQLWHSIVMDIINEIEKIALKWIEQHLLMAAYNAIFHSQDIAQDATATATKTAEHSASNVLMATSDAGLAAAGTFAFYSAIFPPTAPAFAAAAFAEGMGFAALASAEGGMVSDREQLAFLHRKEMVLPAPLSQGFQHIIGSLNGSAPAAAAVDAGGGSGGTTHNYGGVNISAFDSKGVADMIRRNQREFTRAAAGIVRNGWRPK
jgi:hypothetical protein